jgi:23S rRNA pseudouridine955/2504/2580 synthase
MNEKTGGVRLVRVPDDRAGQRLDNFLLGHLKGAPRSIIYKIVRSGQVRVNGGRAKPDTKLKLGDEVRVPPVRLAEEGDPKTAPKGLLDRLAASIVFEDRAILALNKPSGIAAHGGSGISFGVIEGLRALRPDEPIELVHRLARDTSGVLVLAKKRSALLELQALMRGGEDDEGPGKRYLALLVGRVPDGTLTVDVPLRKSVMQGGERMVRVDPEGKPSVSHIKVLERRAGMSFCEIRIETGRTHQIRVHAAHVGHPVAGDPKYGDFARNKAFAKEQRFARMFLHARELAFDHPATGERITLAAPLPAECQTLLNQL